jgi:twitching motility two-component system response regulator PilG
MKVLVVDDTNTVRTLVQLYLMSPAWEFAEASDGVEGLAKARALVPDIVISDVRMPQMDGFELCAAIRGDPALRHAAVLLLSMLDDEASRERGRMVGATAFLKKPVSPADLREAVRRATAGRAAP